MSSNERREKMSESTKVIRIMPKSAALMAAVRLVLGKDCTIDQSHEEYFDVKTDEDYVDLMDLVQEATSEKGGESFDWELVPE